MPLLSNDEIQQFINRCESLSAEYSKQVPFSKGIAEQLEFIREQVVKHRQEDNLDLQKLFAKSIASFHAFFNLDTADCRSLNNFLCDYDLNTTESDALFDLYLAAKNLPENEANQLLRSSVNTVLASLSAYYGHSKSGLSKSNSQRLINDVTNTRKLIAPRQGEAPVMLDDYMKNATSRTRRGFWGQIGFGMLVIGLMILGGVAAGVGVLFAPTIIGLVIGALAAIPAISGSIMIMKSDSILRTPSLLFPAGKGMSQVAENIQSQRLSR